MYVKAARAIKGAVACGERRLKNIGFALAEFTGARSGDADGGL